MTQQFRVEAPIEKPWQNAILTAPNSLNTATQQQASELTVIYGQSVNEQQPIKLPATRHLLWLDAKQLSHLIAVIKDWKEPLVGAQPTRPLKRESVISKTLLGCSALGARSEE